MQNHKQEEKKLDQDLKTGWLHGEGRIDQSTVSEWPYPGDVEGRVKPKCMGKSQPHYHQINHIGPTKLRELAYIPPQTVEVSVVFSHTHSPTVCRRGGDCVVSEYFWY